VLVGLATLVAAPLEAQTHVSAQTNAASQPTPARPGTPTVEKIENPFVMVPDVKLTRINDRTAHLAGGHAGWLLDRQLFFGGGGYLLTNRSDAFKVQYGGLVVGWDLRGTGPVDLSLRTLLGGGTATLSAPFAEFVDGRTTGVRFGGRSVGFSRFPTDRAATVRFHDAFFIAEPEVAVVWRFASWAALETGASYRLIGSSDALDDRLSGVAGTIGIRFGGRD
jgi:hypothetical protein